MSPRGHLVDLRPVRERPLFRRYWVSGLLSGVGSQVAVVAVLFQVWEMTRNPFWVGAIGLVQAVPMIVLGIVGGPVADLLDRRRVVLWTTAAQALAALGLASQLVVGQLPLAAVLGLVATQTAASALGAPSRRTFTPRLLPRDLLPAGIMLMGLSFQAGVLVGPALGGVLLDVGSAGLCYLLNAVALLLSWLIVRSLPAMVPDGAGAVAGASLRARLATAVAMLGEGAAVVARRPVLRGSFLIDLAATLLAFPVALFPMLNEERFGGDPRTLGLFLSAIAVGGLLAGVLSGRVTRARRLGLVQLAAAGLWGMSLLGFALAGPVWLALGLLAVAGAADTLSVTSRAATIQLDTDDSLLGRVSSVEHVIGVAGPDLGNLRAGTVAGLTTPQFAAVTGALACVIAIGIVGLTHRQVRDFRA